MALYQLLSEQNAKTSKGESLGYLTGILYLTPHTQSGMGNLCPFASKGCAQACLYTAGRGRFLRTQHGRLRKTQLFFRDAKKFTDTLARDIDKLDRRATRLGLTPAIRLNGTSDIPWERMRTSCGMTLMEIFPFIQFYDYTKRPIRAKLPYNYHITFSRSEYNEVNVMEAFNQGWNVAVVFSTARSKPLPEHHYGRKVINGDAHDLRFLDPPNCIVGLRAKGDAKHDTSGFVVKG